MLEKLAATILLMVALSTAQRRVDPRFSYNRLVCVVPLVGAGTTSDPKRPEYAPWPPSQNQSGIIAYYFIPSDNGKSAVVEFVAANRTALLPILNDKSIQVFEKGRVPKGIIESAIKPVRKDFNLDTFGMVM